MVVVPHQAVSRAYSWLCVFNDHPGRDWGTIDCVRSQTRVNHYRQELSFYIFKSRTENFKMAIVIVITFAPFSS